MTIVSPEELRPLPARPNLEYERKRAKKLVREAGGGIKLAEAQLRIAREYGFASWRKLLAYYDTWARHDRVASQVQSPSHDPERAVRQIMLEFSNRKAFEVQPPDIIGTGATLSAYVPRFYGLSDSEIFSSTLTEAEAQLAVARRSHFSSYDELRAASEARRALENSHPRVVKERPDWKPGTPISLAFFADGADDRERITRLFTEQSKMSGRNDPASMASRMKWLFVFRALGALPDRHEMLAWIKSLGIDVQMHLNHQLLGNEHAGTRTDDIRIFLDLGADVHWLPPNGYTVLEHAAVRYANGDALDLIARRTAPPKSFWMAAALGDVPTMLQFVNKRGVPTEAARRNRPDFDLLGIFGPVRPDAPDHHIVFEAFFLAGINGRLDAMRALVDRGFPIDYSPVWFNTLHVSIDRLVIPTVEFLLAHGANPNFKAWPDQSSPLDIAETHRGGMPKDEMREHVYQLVKRASSA